MTGPELLAVLDSVIRRSGHVVASDAVQARAALADLMADVKQAHAALTQAQTFPADIDLARKALAHAMDRVGGKTDDRAPIYRLIEAAQRASALMDQNSASHEPMAAVSDELYEAAKKVDELLVLTTPEPLGGGCSYLRLYQINSTLHQPTRIAAILADDKAAAAYMAEHPGSTVVVLVPGGATVVHDCTAGPETDEQRKAREAKDANDGR